MRRETCVFIRRNMKYEAYDLLSLIYDDNECVYVHFSKRTHTHTHTHTCTQYLGLSIYFKHGNKALEF